MNVEKNSYTFIFATIMVLIVAALLATTAISLKPHQETNVALEKKQNILSSIGVDVENIESNSAIGLKELMVEFPSFHPAGQTGIPSSFT